MNTLTTKTQISAGGVIFKRGNAAVEVALICVAGKNKRWQLPKGIIDKGETPESAAVREVREETGLSGEILKLIEKVEYWYVASVRLDRVRYHKFVYFFLLRFQNGDVSQHDHEVLEARWFDIDEAIEKISFKSERDVLEKAKVAISSEL